MPVSLRPMPARSQDPAEMPSDAHPEPARASRSESHPSQSQSSRQAARKSIPPGQTGKFKNGKFQRILDSPANKDWDGPQPARSVEDDPITLSRKKLPIAQATLSDNFSADSQSDPNSAAPLSQSGSRVPRKTVVRIIGEQRSLAGGSAGRSVIVKQREFGTAETGVPANNSLDSEMDVDNPPVEIENATTDGADAVMSLAMAGEPTTWKSRRNLPSKVNAAQAFDIISLESTGDGAAQSQNGTVTPHRSPGRPRKNLVNTAVRTTPSTSARAMETRKSTMPVVENAIPLERIPSPSRTSTASSPVVASRVSSAATSSRKSPLNEPAEADLPHGFLSMIRRIKGFLVHNDQTNAAEVVSFEPEAGVERGTSSDDLVQLADSVCQTDKVGLVDCDPGWTVHVALLQRERPGMLSSPTVLRMPSSGGTGHEDAVSSGFLRAATSDATGEINGRSLAELEKQLAEEITARKKAEERNRDLEFQLQEARESLKDARSARDKAKADLKATSRDLLERTTQLYDLKKKRKHSASLSSTDDSEGVKKGKGDMKTLIVIERDQDERPGSCSSVRNGITVAAASKDVNIMSDDDDDEFKCDACSRRCESYDALKLHIHRVHPAPAQLLHCSYCERTFKRADHKHKHEAACEKKSQRKNDDGKNPRDFSHRSLSRSESVFDISEFEEEDDD